MSWVGSEGDVMEQDLIESVPKTFAMGLWVPDNVGLATQEWTTIQIAT